MGRRRCRFSGTSESRHHRYASRAVTLSGEQCFHSEIIGIESAYPFGSLYGYVDGSYGFAFRGEYTLGLYAEECRLLEGCRDVYRPVAG